MWKQRLLNNSVKLLFRRRIHALHLVKYNTVIRELPGLLIDLIMPALLHHDLFLLIHIRIKNGIHINMHQIMKILLVQTCKRIYCLVRISHCI